MHRVIASLLVLSPLLFFNSCDRDDPATSIRFEGIDLRNEVNEPMGTKGTTDLNDWQNDGTLPPKVMQLFDEINGDASLAGAGTGDVRIMTYPNPCRYYFMMRFQLTSNSLVSMIVVNEKLEILTYNTFYGSSELQVDVTDPVLYPSQKIVRVYYTVSGENNKNYYVGHGDVWICKENTCSL